MSTNVKLIMALFGMAFASVFGGVMSFLSLPERPYSYFCGSVFALLLIIAANQFYEFMEK